MCGEKFYNDFHLQQLQNSQLSCFDKCTLELCLLFLWGNFCVKDKYKSDNLYRLISDTQLSVSSSSCIYTFWTLEIILGMTSLCTAALTNSVVVFENHVLQYLSHILSFFLVLSYHWFFLEKQKAVCTFISHNISKIFKFLSLDGGRC